MKRVSIMSMGLAALLFAACSNGAKQEQKEAAEETETSTATTAPTESQAVIQEEKKEEPAKLSNVIASKQIDKGVLNVTKVAVVGSILNVELVLENPEKRLLDLNVPAEDIYFIDDATAKKNSLLKDDSGRFMITPVNSEGKRLRFMGSDEMLIITFRFAVPPADSKTISLTVGKYGNFDALPITR